ncbi:MAG: GntR family transcriptional regulator [Ruminococcaceae bacterium]|nr:GntR family transcriptional regulator [Oscillospiraceae bacterium]
MISVNYRDARPLYEQIKESVIKMITTRALVQDERLPSVRELAVKLAINPNTIQRAYRELENEGYIYTVTGKGAFVAPQKEAKADVSPLLNSFRESAAKLLYTGMSSEELKAVLEQIDKEVNGND